MQGRILALKDAEIKGEPLLHYGEERRAAGENCAPAEREKKREEKIPVSSAEKPAAPSHAKSSTQKTTSLHFPHSPAALEAYRTLLTEIWSDGNVSNEEQSQIDSMKETFAITEKDHKEIERKSGLMHTSRR